MPDFTKMTVRNLRELARKLLGPGHSRLRTKAEIVRALEEAAAAPTRAVGKVRAAATRAADATGKAVRAVGEAVGKAARSRRAGGEAPAPTGSRKPTAKAARRPAAGAGEAAPRRKGAAAAAGAVVGAALGATAATPGRASRKARKVATAAGKAAGAAVGAVVGAAAGERATRRRRAAPRPGPDPDGFFVARVRGEDAIREAPHALVEPPPEGDEDDEAVVPVIADEQLGELAWGYGDDAFVALPRDPRTLFLYWDWSPDTTARAFAGLDQPRAQLWIFERAGAGWERVRTIEFALESRGYYVHDLQPGRLYRAEIHAVDRHGRERLLSHGSNEVALPPVGPSSLVDDRFVRIPWDLPLGRLLGHGHAGAPFPEEARALLARLSDWSRFAAREGRGSAGGMGGRPSSPTRPSSPAGPYGPREP